MSVLSSWSSSCREYAMKWRYVCGVTSTSVFRVENVVTSPFPRSMPRMGHLPPFEF